MLANEVKLLKEAQDRQNHPGQLKKKKGGFSFSNTFTSLQEKLGSKFWLILAVVSIVSILLIMRLINSGNKTVTEVIPSEPISTEAKKAIMAQQLSGSSTSAPVNLLSSPSEANGKKSHLSASVEKELKESVQSGVSNQSSPKVSSAVQLPNINTSTEEKDAEAKKEESGFNYIQKRKKILMSKFLDFEVSIDIISDKPMITIKGVPYRESNKMLDGFMLGKITVEKGKTGTIEDLILKSSILDEKSGEKVRSVSSRVGDSYSVSFYEGGVKILEKNSTRSTNIVLPGEHLSSILVFNKTEEGKDSTKYFFTLPNGQTFVETVSNDNIF